MLLKFKYLPHLEIYKSRDIHQSGLDDDIRFLRSNTEDTLVNALITELHQSKGDSVAYIEILMKFYQQRTLAAKKEITVLTKQLHDKN